MSLLPTLPGKVHGVVGLDPLTIQCDGCGEVRSHPIAVIAAHFALFNPRLKDDDRRLCRECAKDAGWSEEIHA